MTTVVDPREVNETSYTSAEPPSELVETCVGESGEAYVWKQVCYRTPGDGASCSEQYGESAADRYDCGLQKGADVVCDPFMDESGDECCFLIGGGCPIGRPFIVAGEARCAQRESVAGWSLDIQPDISGLDRDTRGALAEAYTRDGLAEHASVAAFARFMLQCLAVGAPMSIIAGAAQASADELEHARIGFGLARAYGGNPVGPGRLRVEGAMDGALTPLVIAASTAAEGCVAETVSALLVAAARDAAEDPVVKRLLARIAADELAHAELAWRYVTWAVRCGDEAVSNAVAEVLRNARRYVGLGAVTERRGNEKQMRAHGYLPVAERRAVASAVLRVVVAPAARALLESAPVEKSPGSRLDEPSQVRSRRRTTSA